MIRPELNLGTAPRDQEADPSVPEESLANSRQSWYNFYRTQLQHRGSLTVSSVEGGTLSEIVSSTRDCIVTVHAKDAFRLVVLLRPQGRRSDALRSFSRMTG